MRSNDSVGPAAHGIVQGSWLKRSMATLAIASSALLISSGTAAAAPAARADGARPVLVDGSAAVTPAARHHGDPAGWLPIRRCRDGSDAFARTDLYFGLSRPGGSVSEEEFDAFVDSYVSSRFPDGLTLINGTGYFRDARGATVREGAKVLILLYAPDDRDAGSRIEAIRSDYRTLFEQESVLRTDDVTCAQF